MSNLLVERNRMDVVWLSVKHELIQATNKFGPMRSSHEGYAVLKEEVDELWDAIKTNQSNEEMRREATQIAAMAIRFIMDVAGYPMRPSQKEIEVKGQSEPGPEYHEMMEDIHQKAQRGEDI